jgi:cytochrome c oxidase subunit 2
MKQIFKRLLPGFLSAVLIGGFLCLTHPALADEVGMAKPWQLGMQPAATPVAEWQHHFHQELLYIITFICALVLALLIFVVLRFNARANPVPSTRTHNVKLEIVWTLVPILLLMCIAVPSMKLLYYGDRAVKPELTIKVTGNQWYWNYEYPTYDGLSYMSNYLHKDEVKSGQTYLLSVDKPLVLPVGTNVQILVTAADVIHSFAVPAFGIKTDAIPGRLNETWVNIEHPGTYYGQCSQLCGRDHGFMPVEVRAVPKAEFAAWADAAKANYISYDDFEAGRGNTPAAQ